ncbi:MAG: FAD-dependent oxidoreductase [Chloroflexi bacterium]|nr:FAD-dependent oxidoreductase [Chloroflexota bacterium]
MARVLVLGGGFGGIAAATRLRWRLGPNDRVTLVDRRSEFVMGLRKTWAVVGSHRLRDGARSLATLRSRGIEVVEGTVEAVDPAGLRVSVDGEWLAADALVVALGADQVPGAIPGLVEHGINVWDRDLATRGHDALAGMRSGRLLIGVFGLPYACPPGPFELALLAKELLDRRAATVSVAVFGPMPIALPVVGPTESAKVDAILEAAGITFHRGHAAIEVTPGTVRFSDDTTLPFDVLFGIPPHRCPALLVDAGLAVPGGWVSVNPTTLETGFRGVYAIGDCTIIKLANGLALPKAGVFAEAEGYVAAERIADEIAGRASSATFAGEGVCYAEVGEGRAAAVQGRFLADPPGVSIAQPSAEAVASKAAFEADRLTGWFGS